MTEPKDAVAPKLSYIPVVQHDYVVLNDTVRMSKSISALTTALSVAQGQMKPAEKGSVNPHFKSKYADLASIIDSAKESLAKNGLSICQSPSGNPPYVKITTILMHKSGEWISGELTMKANSDTPQNMGAAITYAKRYALAAMLNIPAEEDDDGNAASAPSSSPRQSALPVSSSDNPGDVQVPYGKNAGKKISEISPQDQMNDLKYWNDREAKEGKPLGGKVAQYRDALRAYLEVPAPAARQPQFDDIPNFDDIPF